MHHLPGLLPRVMEACNIDGGVPESINECTLPCKGCCLIRSRTFLALTRATVSCAESSDVSLRAVRTRLAGLLALPILKEIPKRVAADAAELPWFRLKVACESILAQSSRPPSSSNEGTC
jgi:hypothetical protein